MLTANFKVFCRYLVRKKLFTCINIPGLGVGLACVLLLALYVQDEWSFDRHHPAAERKYAIGMVYKAGSEVLNIDTAAAPAVQVLKANFPEITDTTRILRQRFHLAREGENGKLRSRMLPVPALRYE